MTLEEFTTRATEKATASHLPRLDPISLMIIGSAIAAAIGWLVERGLDWLFPKAGRQPGAIKRLALWTVVNTVALPKAMKERGVSGVPGTCKRELCDRVVGGIVDAGMEMSEEEFREIGAASHA